MHRKIRITPGADYTYISGSREGNETIIDRVLLDDVTQDRGGEQLDDSLSLRNSNFLCSDVRISASRDIRIYALRDVRFHHIGNRFAHDDTGTANRSPAGKHSRTSGPKSKGPLRPF